MAISQQCSGEHAGPEALVCARLDYVFRLERTGNRVPADATAKPDVPICKPSPVAANRGLADVTFEPLTSGRYPRPSGGDST